MRGNNIVPFFNWEAVRPVEWFDEHIVTRTFYRTNKYLNVATAFRIFSLWTTKGIQMSSTAFILIYKVGTYYALGFQQYFTNRSVRYLTQQLNDRAISAVQSQGNILFLSVAWLEKYERNVRALGWVVT